MDDPRLWDDLIFNGGFLLPEWNVFPKNDESIEILRRDIDDMGNNLYETKVLLRVPTTFRELFNHIEELKKIRAVVNTQLLQYKNYQNQTYLEAAYELKKSSLRLHQILLHIQQIKNYYRHRIENVLETSAISIPHKSNIPDTFHLRTVVYSFARRAEAVGEHLSTEIEAKLYQLKEAHGQGNMTSMK